MIIRIAGSEGRLIEDDHTEIEARLVKTVNIKNREIKLFNLYEGEARGSGQDSNNNQPVNRTKENVEKSGAKVTGMNMF
jgi:hypothetical protein